MDIKARTRRSLEWERLKSFLAAEAASQWSRELCLEAEVSDSRGVVETLISETDEALAMLTAGFGLSQDGLPELRDVLSRVRTGAQLGASELVDIRKMLQLARRTRGQLHQLSSEDFPRLSTFSENIYPNEPLVDSINDVFDEDGHIRDDASPLLRSLRRDVQRLTNQTRDELQRIINSANASKALQEPLYTQRNGRYVLPVQASMRSSIQGIVHDSSSSGLTVYVEPMSVVELTNSVRLKESEIEREIDRLLSELSALVREKHEELDQSHRTLVEVDFIAARARLARRYNGVKPELSADGRMVLKQARHPLLVLQNQNAPSSVVANDIVLGGDVKTMIITGPNTGGKTVYLKSAGLLALMLGAGLLLPVQHGSIACVFKDVFADIGDEQSIEQNLSTFSSHMTNIIEVVDRSAEGTLVLLDEIGAGTDPREGAILARVILERLTQSGALTITTTHYGEMKSLGYTTSGFLNASFEFDDQNLAPTYRLRIGIPGSSKAVTIASRLGLAPDLVRQAEELLAAGQTDIQEMIDELERRLHDADEKQQQLVAQQREVGELQAKLKEREENLAVDREKARRAAAARMERELEEARDLVRSLIADLQKQPSIAKAQRLQKDLAVLRSELGWLEPAEGEETGTTGGFGVGDYVRVMSLNQKGTIEALPEEGKTGAEAQATVRAGAMKIKVPLSDLQAVQGGGPAGTHVKSAGTGSRTRVKSPAAAAHSRTSARVSAGPAEVDVFVRTTNNTLDIRGQRVDEALGNIESFVDSAFLERLSPIMIIHGHGTGQLRAAVRRFLTDSPYKAKWRPGENYEGGDGVTVVQFE